MVVFGTHTFTHNVPSIGRGPPRVLFALRGDLAPRRPTVKSSLVLIGKLVYAYLSKIC